MTLKYLHWPLVEVKPKRFSRPAYYPLELCFVPAQLKESKDYSSVVKTAIQKDNELSPTKRKELTDYFVKTMMLNNPVLHHYGISISSCPRIIQSAVVLPAPMVCYGNNVRHYVDI